MKNINFLVEILTTKHEYWIAQKEDTWADKTIHRSVWFICIPPARRDTPRTEIFLTDLEDLQNSSVQNIPLTEDHAPFQNGITMRSFTLGFPVKKHVKQSLRLLLSLRDSNDINEYKSILDNAEKESLPL